MEVDHETAPHEQSLPTAERLQSWILPRFAQGVADALLAWPELRAAVRESWAGADSEAVRIWMASFLVDGFLDRPPTVQDPLGGLTMAEVEELLRGAFEDTYSVVLDDDDAAVVSEQIFDLWQELVRGEEQKLSDLAARAVKAMTTPLNLEVQYQDASDDDDETPMQAPNAQQQQTRASRRDSPEIDEDGFETVRRR